MLSFRYTSVFFYTFLFFSAGTSNGSVNPQNETILARVRRTSTGTLVALTSTQTGAIVTKINGLRGAVDGGATDMTIIAYSNCLATIAATVVARCDKSAKTIPLATYLKGKTVSAIFHNEATATSNDLPTIMDAFTKVLTSDKKCEADTDCMDYAKLIFKDSYEVGCARATCPSYKLGGDAEDLTLQTASVCLLGPNQYTPGGVLFTAGTTVQTGCDTATKLCPVPSDTTLTATACPTPDPKPTQKPGQKPAPKPKPGDEGSSEKGDEENKKNTSGKKKSMGVQSAKPQVVLAVVLTAILSLFLAH